MEEYIQDELEKIYKNVEIEVHFHDFRKYEISIKINGYKKSFIYTWDNSFIDEYNIQVIANNIDYLLIKYFKED